MSQIKIKKSLLLGLVCILCVALSGCMQAQIDCGIDNDYNAYLKINIQMDLTGMDAESAQAIREGMRKLKNDYQENRGYEVKAAISPLRDSITLEMELIRPSQSYTAAFEQLKAMLTDENLTPFTSVSMSHTGDAFEHGFAVEVKLDAHKMLQTVSLEGLPKELNDFFQQGVDHSAARLCFTLPATEVIANTGVLEREGAFARVEESISLDHETALTMVTRVHLVNGAADRVAGKDAARQAASQHSWLQAAMYVFTALFLLCVIFLCVMLLRRRRKKAKAGRPM